MTFSTHDWSQNSAEAWIYGIVIGWDEESLADIAKQHGWPKSNVARLNRLHKQFASLRMPEPAHY